MDNNLINTLKEKMHGAHDYSHIERILRYGKQINEVHKGSWKIIEAALMLHEITKNDLPSIKIYLPDFSAEEIEQVTYCIARHYDFVNKPETLEGKIMQDCDILDMLGSVGIARAFLASGERGLGPNQATVEYKKKRFMVIDQLNLAESKKLAKEKSVFTKLFFETLEKELVK